MSKLQFLNFYSNISQEALYDPDGLESLWNEGLYLPQGLESLPNELRYISWMHYPLESLPTNFSAENLVILDLSYNRMEKLWHGVKVYCIHLCHIVLTFHFSSNSRNTKYLGSKNSYIVILIGLHMRISQQDFPL